MAEKEPLTKAKAAEIAREHGLSMADAAGLATLAETVEEAESMAHDFAQPSPQQAAEKILNEQGF